jgi:hypothetical protein
MKMTKKFARAEINRLALELDHINRNQARESFGIWNIKCSHIDAHIEKLAKLVKFLTNVESYNETGGQDEV